MFVLGGSYLLYRKTVLTFNVPSNFAIKTPADSDPSNPHNANLARPTNIEIPRVRVNLSITPGLISDKGVWQISDTGASFLNSSAFPGANSNVVIYGHNKTNLLGPLRWIKPGDTIIIQTEDGKSWKYQVQETLTVSPDEISVVMPTEKEVLTVYTCTGFLDSQRFVVRAKLVE